MSSFKEFFPDGTPIDNWFYSYDIPKLENMGRQYTLTDFGIFDDGKIYTAQIQSVIDKAYENGGGVVVVPAGTYLTGSLYFKQGVNLYIEKGGTLKGSDDISDYDICETRIEGETCLYYCALINADSIDGFTMCGEGTVDGNGLRSWKAFWQRHKWNPKCTNKDEQRPRLVYISNCKNVTIANLNLQNSHYWTNHIYKCQFVKFLNCRIFSPFTPVKAPSTDAIDIDVCTDVLVKNCYIHVNDDSVVLKGGKGPTADTLPENGSNERILIEDCIYAFCHGCLTCGSESVHNRNIILRRSKILSAYNLLWIKLRPDTPQLYEYISVEDIDGVVESFININPWTQFYDLKGHKNKPISVAEHITMRNCKISCRTYFDVTSNENQYRLSDFTFENLKISAKNIDFNGNCIKNMIVKNIELKKITE